MTIVVTTQVGPDFVSLVAFLAEKLMEFAVTNDATISDSDALNAPQASDEETRMVRRCVEQEEPKLNAPIELDMEQVARDNKRNLAAQNLPQASEDQSRLATKSRSLKTLYGTPTVHHQVKELKAWRSIFQT
ncbi:hypothetical protein B9Z55_023548 [Caenorhabditis nigoni]|nr:hypothetical protein B9Z55_023548 [Caenorhabditis nigoni]